MPTAESLAADELPAVPELAGAAAAHAANGGGGDQPQRFRGATLLRQPGEALEKAGELMRASQQAAAAQAAAAQGPGAREVASSARRLAAFGRSVRGPGVGGLFVCSTRVHVWLLHPTPPSRPWDVSCELVVLRTPPNPARRGRLCAAQPAACRLAARQLQAEPD